MKHYEIEYLDKMHTDGWVRARSLNLDYPTADAAFAAIGRYFGRNCPCSESFRVIEVRDCPTRTEVSPHDR